MRTAPAVGRAETGKGRDGPPQPTRRRSPDAFPIFGGFGIPDAPECADFPQIIDVPVTAPSAPDMPPQACLQSARPEGATCVQVDAGINDPRAQCPDLGFRGSGAFQSQKISAAGFRQNVDNRFDHGVGANLCVCPFAGAGTIGVGRKNDQGPFYEAVPVPLNRSCQSRKTRTWAEQLRANFCSTVSSGCSPAAGYFEKNLSA